MSAETPRPPIDARYLTRLLCDEAWHGRWDLRGETNIRPQAQITAQCLVDALAARGLSIVPVAPEETPCRCHLDPDVYEPCDAADCWWGSQRPVGPTTEEQP